jgi:hypothetical protein
VHIEILAKHWLFVAGWMLFMAVSVGATSRFWFNTYVATAVVLVGGGSDQTDLITASGNLETYSIKLDQLAAQGARLDAQITGMNEISFPPTLLDRQKEPGVEAMLNGERLTLAASRRSLHEKLEGVRQQRKLLEAGLRIWRNRSAWKLHRLRQ